MAQIAVRQQSLKATAGRAGAGVLLVAVGVAAGLGIGQIATQSHVPALSTTGTAAAIAANDAWRTFRMGERQGAPSLLGDPGYEAFRSGERAGVVPLSGNLPYQAFRSGERHP